MYLMKKDKKGIVLSDFAESFNFSFSILQLCPIVSNSRGSTCQSAALNGVDVSPDVVAMAGGWWYVNQTAFSSGHRRGMPQHGPCQ